MDDKALTRALIDLVDVLMTEQQGRAGHWGHPPTFTALANIKSNLLTLRDGPTLKNAAPQAAAMPVAETPTETRGVGPAVAAPVAPSHARDIEAAIDAEPELPGHMPDEMWEVIKGDRDAAEEAMRIVVRQTKDNIRKRLAVSATSRGNTALADKVSAFLGLKKNWDSYGADAFQEATIKLAHSIALMLEPEWKAVPCADGPSVWFYRGNEDEIIEVRTNYEKSDSDGRTDRVRPAPKEHTGGTL